LLDVTVDSDDFVDNARPWFLQSPTTGEFLEYDRYYKIGVAFEFNGAQHYGTTELFPDEAKVIETQKRDEVKARLSRIRRVLLDPGDEGLLPGCTARNLGGGGCFRGSRRLCCQGTWRSAPHGLGAVT
jgi:hypothetical protein